MNSIKLKRATMDDLLTIQTLNDKLFKYEMDRDLDEYISNWAFGKESKEYFSDLIENNYVILATVDNEPVGYLAGSLYQDDTYSYYDGLTAELDNMFIEEEYRKLGIGSKLINAFTEWCKKQSAKRIFVTATIGNDNTIEFYKKHGFKDLNITLRKKL
jgi:GNAT superfamily N-acetyltransferase